MPKELTPEDRQRCEAIRSFRQAYGISSGDLAKAAGITPRWLVYIEMGQRAPTTVVCRKIADVLGIPLGAITSAAFRPEGTSTDSAA